MNQGNRAESHHDDKTALGEFQQGYGLKHSPLATGMRLGGGLRHEAGNDLRQSITRTNDRT